MIERPGLLRLQLDKLGVMEDLEFMEISDPLLKAVLSVYWG